MEELVKINENEKGDILINGRELHQFLEVKTKYIDWVNRMLEYGFEENIDFIEFNELSQKKEGSRLVERTVKTHMLKISMAKEIAMLQRNEKGKQIRLYFIEIENRYNDPMYQLAKSLKYANNLIESKNNEIKNLMIENQQKQEIIEVQQPKVEYYDKVTNSKKATGMSEVAKVLKFKVNNRPIGRNILFSILRDSNILNEYNQPYQRFINLGYFEVRQTFNSYTGEPYYTTLVTSKGIDFILKYLRRLGYKEYE